ncbi:tryptophan--tRNA ligase [Dermacoccaceae bacterium W4C1]
MEASSPIDATTATTTQDPVSSEAADASFSAARERSDALRCILDGPDGPLRRRQRVLTGDRPTGPLHVGHLLASLRQRVALQDSGIDTFVIVADYQVITDRDSVGAISDNVLGCVADYLAAGIDPARSTIFTHSAIPELNQLLLPFLALVTDAELRRNPTVKDELAATDGRPLSGLLLTYPVHQAADILFCGGTVVPVGRDNLPHVEQARVVARRFNRRFAGGQQVFTEPVALLSRTPLLLGLDGHKMSKSRGNAITLGASADETARLIRRARTDGERRISYDPVTRPEVATLLTLAAAFTDSAPEVVAEQIGDAGAGRLKEVTTAAVNEGLAGHRARRAELIDHPDYLREVMRAGNARAREEAVGTLARVRSAMGMNY